MLNYCLVNASLVNLIGIIFTFVATFFALKFLMDYLPHDQGRAFAVDGAKSACKPRGAGIIFVFTFVIGLLLVTILSVEIVINFVCIIQ